MSVTVKGSPGAINESKASETVAARVQSTFIAVGSRLVRGLALEWRLSQESRCREADQTVHPTVGCSDNVERQQAKLRSLLLNQRQARRALRASFQRPLLALVSVVRHTAFVLSDC